MRYFRGQGCRSDADAAVRFRRPAADVRWPAATRPQSHGRARVQKRPGRRRRQRSATARQTQGESSGSRRPLNPQLRYSKRAVMKTRNGGV